MELKGTLKVINQVVNISEKFRKREFVVTTEDKYPQDILFQLTQDNCDLIDEFGIGEEVVVGFNLRGREWLNPKTNVMQYFNTLEAWRITGVLKNVPVAKVKASGVVGNFVEDAINDMVDDDMPF